MEYLVLTALMAGMLALGASAKDRPARSRTLRSALVPVPVESEYHWSSQQS
jgi:hypothetical protein